MWSARRRHSLMAAAVFLGFLAVAPAGAQSPLPSEKINAYVRCINQLSPRAYEALERYKSWVARSGPTGKERIIYGTYTISDPAGCQRNVEQAKAMAPHDDGLENAADAYVASVVALAPLLREADAYYRQENYKDDGMAKGKALHPRLVAAWQAFATADKALTDRLEVLRAARTAARLGEIEKTEGRNAKFYAEALLVGARRILDGHRTQPADVAVIFRDLQAYETLFREAEQHAAAKPPEVVEQGYMRNHEAFLTTAKKLMRRVRDKTTYDAGEQMIQKSGGGWMLEGSHERLIRDFNDITRRYNRGRLTTTVSATPTAGAEGIVGRWDSNQGPLSITKDAENRYFLTFSRTEGKVTGTLSGKEFVGTWVRSTGTARCKTSKDGSHFWGAFKVTFHRPEIFQGYWLSCDDEGNALLWSGGRLP